MSNKNVNKPGYKPTQLGWIPEEWDERKFDEIAVINPARIVLEDDQFVSFISMASVSEEGKVIRFEQKKYGDVKLGFTAFRNKDVLVAKITPCFENGKGALVDKLVNNAGFGSTEFHVIRAGRQVLPDFVFYITRTNEFRANGEISMTGSAGQKRVPRDFISSYRVPLPPLEEQSMIVEVLQKCDQAISVTEKLIETLRTRNKGLMQQLLTGKKRIKGFEKEKWKRIFVEGNFNIIRSHSISRDGLSAKNEEGMTYCIHYGDIHTSYKNGFIDFERDAFIPQIMDSDYAFSNEDLLEEGDIVIADASEDYEGVGEAVEVKNIGNKKALGGLHSIVLRDVKDVLAEGIGGYLFNSQFTRNALRRKATGTSVFSVTKSTVRSLEVAIPGKQGQRAIIEILDSAFDELSVYEQKLSMLKLQKKALMQKLLTGEIRVKSLAPIT